MEYNCYLQNILLGLMVFSVTLLTGCTKPISEFYPPGPGRTDNKTVYVVNHGLHTGIVLPKKDAASYMHAFNDFKSARYLEIGWGDEIYYQTDPNTLWMGIRALFWPTDSVLHVAALQTDPIAYFNNNKVLRLKLSKTGFIRLVEYIDSSFTLNKNRQVIRLGNGLYGTSRFYRAEGKFHLFNNCNTWSARAISHSGFPINTCCIFTADDLITQLERRKK
ncbi:DUF2459 domain-containing protein [Sulfurovum sp. TSL1]|uniref:DUF2459 domain-containing protein n=1 Tax=Sulfurovum sp. TSL1 TaxID=2826994 RepID=UPI001CC5FFFC|nr:DUF2459 domain-containing protein [Sulfurovum sp. TSL1]GIT97774.1 membrane protein [Sulfurovum sp. TSL1]